MTPLEGGKANTALRVRADQRDLVVRVAAGGAAALRREAALLAEAGARVPVPELLACEPAHQGCALSIQPFVAGLQLGELWRRADEAACRAAGEALGPALARLHARAWPSPGWLALGEGGALRVEPWGHEQGTPGEDPLLAYVSQALRGRAGERLGAEWRARCLAQLERRASTLDPGPARLVHGDLNPTNVLVSPDGRELRALLDWEWAHAGSPLSDLGNLCRRRPGGGPPPAFVEALAGAYRAAGGELGERWRLAARRVDLSSQVEFLSREDDALARELGAAEILRATVIALEEAAPL